MTKRILSLLLVLALAFTILPQTALMAEPECAHEHTAPLSQSFENSRGDLMYMLWKMVGCPEATITNPFNDVSETDYYYKAILWATENKISWGISDTLFGPERAVTRGQAVTFLWRAFGCPEPSLTQNPFKDVSDTAFYYKPILWACEAGWLELNTDGEFFRPDYGIGEFILEGTVCEDCGSVVEIKKLTFSEDTGAIKAKGTFGENLEWKIAYGTLTITGSGDMPDLEENEEAPWYDYRSEITDIVLSDGLTSIGAGAFSGCTELWSIEFPAGLRRIGEGAFYGSGVENVTIPDGVTVIEEGAFCNCYRLAGAGIPGSVKEIGDCAFLGCTSLFGVDIDEGVERIGNFAFEGCKDMSPLTIPKSVTSIGLGAFHMSGVDEPDSWKSGILYVDHWAVDSDENITSAQIRSGTIGIADGLFFGCEDLKKVTFPDGLKYIGIQSFSNTDLRSVTIPDSVTSLGEGAFYECPHLASVKLPAGITSIEPWTFGLNEKLKSIEIPTDVTHIGEAAFYAAGLTSITIANRECTIEEGEERPAYTLGDPQKTTVYGYVGSPAQAYAAKYGYRFAALSENVSFIDIPAAAFYENPVAWAVEGEITKGLDESHFGPNQGCTRGQVVTFLWRAAGCPEPKNSATPFTDVKSGAFYEKAVAWAVEEGITKGASNTTFSPDATCTRGQIVAFLWRFKGQPDPKSAETPFEDLKPGAFYEKAVAWAVENEVTNGMSADKFGPDATCTRGQVVTFLYRAVEDK